jgi:hypothetical protein
MGRRREGLGSWKYDISHWSGAGPMFKRWAIEREAAAPRNHVKRLARWVGGMGKAEIEEVEMKAGAARVQGPGGVVVPSKHIRNHLIFNPFRVVDLNAAAQGRPSLNRANLGLNDAIPLGLKSRQSKTRSCQAE